MSDPFDCQEFHELMMDYRAHPTGNGPYELVQDYIRRQLSSRLALAEADTKRIDWLADKDNFLGAVQLPSECVLAHVDSMRDAIDAAMRLAALAANGAGHE